MESNQQQPYQTDDTRSSSTTEEEQAGDSEPKEDDELVPGVPIVRSNTPRPLSFDAMLSARSQFDTLPPDVSDDGERPSFPSRAPSAPPLPEELSEEDDTTIPATSLPLAPSAEAGAQPNDAPEFVWLFEYALEMDSSILNSPERLDGLALLYGPALLKDYTLMFAELLTHSGSARVIATAVHRPGCTAELWGVLYRVPRRVTQSSAGEPSLLDTIHSATSTQRLFQAVQLVVEDSFRSRSITCGAYLLTPDAQQRVQLQTLEQMGSEALFVRRLIAIARKQKLPDHYLASLAAAQTLAPSAQISPRPELNTDPLPAMKKVPDSSKEALTSLIALPPARSLLSAFALYLAMLLLTVLFLALLQALGLAGPLSAPIFSPLGVPWLVLVYGLLGGCVSCLVSLGRARYRDLPAFVTLVWFSRPWIGAVLALFTYLLFNSGFFIFPLLALRHDALFPLIGAIAGLCEGWLFFRRD